MGLKKREKRTLIMGGAAAAVIFLLWYFYLSENSLYNRWTNLLDEVAARENTLAQMIRLQTQYRRLDQEIGTVTDRMSGGEEGGTLKGFLEKLIKEQAPSARLRRMPSRDATAEGLYRQTFVTIDLENVTIPELVNIMAGMESAPEGLKVQKLKVILERKGEEMLEAVIIAVAARPLK
ncbi:MAG: hypothetical protein V1789_00240 [PVC group bacterium]